jgi:hypothetical protein
MALSDYIPNVFGQAAPSYLQGLLGAEETQNLQNRANVQGLLGAGLALAQGMSRTGPRRSAAENILGALSGGFGAAGGAYEQGVKNYVTQQQIAQTQLAQTQAANKLKSIAQAKALYPDLAPLADIDPGKFAEEVALRQRMQGFNLTGKETPQELEAKANQIYATGVAGLKPYADSLMQKAQGMALLPPSAQTANQPAAQPAQQPRLEPGLGVTSKGDTFNGVPNYAAGERYVDEAMHQKALESQRTLPPVQKDARSQFESQINNIDNELLRVQQLQPTEANTRYQTNLRARRDILLKDVDRFAVMEYDFTDLSSLPNKYQSEVNQIKRQAQGGALDSSGLNSRIQNLYTKLQEDEKGKALTGNAAVFAQMKFGVTDRTKLSGPQLAEVLRFEDAPTADQLAKLQQTNRQLQFDTGAGVGLPSGKGSFITGGTTTTTEIAPQPAVTREPTAAREPTVVREPTAAKTTAAVTNVQTSTQAAPKFAAPENAPLETKAFYSYNKNALINQPDSKYSPKKKMELREKQAPLQSAVNYSLTSIRDSLDAAQALKNNPQYIDALTGRFSPLLTGTVGGVVISQDAKTANALLENILTRTFVSEIQAMRDASPTGGAVGSVTEKEMDALSKIRASLSVGMNKDEFIKQLDNYLSIANRSLKNIPVEYSKTFGYNGEFDEILTKPAISTSRTSGQDPVQQELDRRKGRKP